MACVVIVNWKDSKLFVHHYELIDFLKLIGGNIVKVITNNYILSTPLREQA